MVPTADFPKKKMHHLTLFDPVQDIWLLFSQPLEILRVTRLADVMPALAYLEKKVNGDGLWAAGFIAYDAAPAFDSALQVQMGHIPLLWFGLFDSPVLQRSCPDFSPDARHCPLDFQPDQSFLPYAGAIARIKSYIEAGHTYQVNYTFKMTSAFSGQPTAFFQQLLQAQPKTYAAYIETDDFAICSISPELFFRLDNQTLITRPMKGTRRRGLTTAQDQQIRAELQASEKDRAENVMIVDMIRNDLGRIAQTGSVQVPALFDAECYPTIWQMTSTVTAQTAAAWVDILRALFPCASITGAPKVHTMRLIRELEAAPRGLYTGAIGYLAPHRQALMNVAIRTVWIDKSKGTAEYGTGSGIIWDSRDRDEYDECLAKARVLTMKPTAFKLLETLRRQPKEGYFLLARHLARLADSAAYFAIPLDLAVIRRALLLPQLTVPARIRLLVDRTGQPEVEIHPLATSPEIMRVGLATDSIDTADPFLYHKTTRRQIYDCARATRPDCDDVLLWNRRHEVTESTMANIVFEMDNRLLTPPVSCGLLAGTFRAELLTAGEISEQSLPVADLKKCRALWLINSVREWQKAILVSDPKKLPS